MNHFQIEHLSVEFSNGLDMYESLGHWKAFWKSWLFCKVPWTLATAGEWGSPSSWLTKDPIVLVSHQTLAKATKNSWSSVKSWSPGRRLLVLICSSFLNFWYALYASFKPPLSTKGINQRKVTFLRVFFVSLQPLDYAKVRSHFRTLPAMFSSKVWVPLTVIGPS